METTRDFIITLLVENIESHFNKYEYYGYLLNNNMNYEIEDIPMCVFIHKEITDNKYYNKYYYKLIVKNIRYDTTNNRVDLFTSNYFDTILELFENLNYVKMNYTFYDNILCSPSQQKKILKLKKSLSFFPKKENECSVCYGPTKQLTICNHPICLPCRSKCIQSNMDNCPICKSTKLSIYPSPDLLFTL